ncbi:putative cinnamyl alcohol dehydrogenase 1 [Citrus sinensis]|nr:putative cinnamyl alcohol dehydrogenase 1 [Citrus sinensis]
MTSETASKDCLGWAARDPSGVLSPYSFNRRAVGSDDVSITITHCGVCYADVIWTRNKHGDSKYPLVPGHEIVGIVKEVGHNVSRFKVGDHVGVGTYVNSCRDCEYCNDGLEVHCARYCYKIANDYPLALAAPLLCAGITVYTPMMRHKMNQPGKSLGVIGLGGLGHMAVKFGKAFGLNVTVLSTSTSKKEEALSLLGADKFVVSSDLEQMKVKNMLSFLTKTMTSLMRLSELVVYVQALGKSLDFIIDTASGDHPFDAYMSLLKVAGVYVLVGFPSKVKFSPASLNIGAKTVSGSVTGGTKDTQEMLEYCAAHKIYPQIETIPIENVNEALERLIKRDRGRWSKDERSTPASREESKQRRLKCGEEAN